MIDTTTSLHAFVPGTVPSVIHGPSKVVFVLMETTHDFGFDSGLRRKAPVPETTKDWFKGTTVSRPDHACRHLLYARLDEYRTGPEEDRWPDAVRPVDEAFADARAFIERLPLSSIPVPEISLADDGEINFLWAGDDAAAYVDLGFYGTGTYSYFARGGDGRGLRGEDVPASKGLPGEIVALLSV